MYLIFLEKRKQGVELRSGKMEKAGLTWAQAKKADGSGGSPGPGGQPGGKGCQVTLVQGPSRSRKRQVRRERLTGVATSCSS